MIVKEGSVASTACYVGVASAAEARINATGEKLKYIIFAVDAETIREVWKKLHPTTLFNPEKTKQVVIAPIASFTED